MGRVRAVAVVASLMVLVSCNSNKQETSPTTTTTNSPPAVTTTPSSPPTTAPPVSQPLEAADYEADPCVSLTDAQKQTFGIDRTERKGVEIDGETCFFYRGPDDRKPVSVVFASKVKTGLSAKYAEHATGTWNYWAPTELDGYPALAFGNSDNELHCFFAVGITDALYYSVSAEVNAGEERCSAARNVAGAILATIKFTG